MGLFGRRRKPYRYTKCNHVPYTVFHTDNYTDEVTAYRKCKKCGALIDEKES